MREVPLFFLGGGPWRAFFFSIFVTSSVIFVVVNATGFHCVCVHAVATFMVNQGSENCFVQLRCERIKIQTQFNPACRFKLKVRSAFITVLIVMGIGYN